MTPRVSLKQVDEDGDWTDTLPRTDIHNVIGLEKVLADYEKRISNLEKKAGIK
jgi:hypothetical protein